MKHTFKISAFLAIVLLLVGCSKEKETNEQYSVTYTVSRHDIANKSTTVAIKTDKERDELLERLCDFTKEGKFVTLRSSKKCKAVSKSPITFSTTSREEIKRWMSQMEDEGKTVTVTYDQGNGTWSGIAYAIPPHDEGRDGRVERVTLDYTLYPTNYEIHSIYTYFWNGDLLTSVDMVKETFNGLYSEYSHTTASITYNGNLRSAIYFYDSIGSSVGNILYSYNNGRLIQEVRGDNTYQYNYNDQGFIESWTITPGYNTALPNGIRCEWENGDVVRTYIGDQLYESFEYDTTPKPYALSLGSLTLMPEYSRFIDPEALLSTHNLTRLFTNSKDQGTALEIEYTYRNGLPVTARILSWYGYGNIHWTYEYLE